MVKFYMVFPRQEYAGYIGKSESDESAIERKHPPKDSDYWRVPTLIEYLGDPPGKPKRRGDYHAGGWKYLFSERAVNVLEKKLSHAGVWFPVEIDGRKENFFRFWITRQVDCLDSSRSVVSEGGIAGNIGVIKKLAIDESKWDGSALFGLPNDANLNLIASEGFMEACKNNRIRGIEFRKEFFDDDPIKV